MIIEKKGLSSPQTYQQPFKDWHIWGISPAADRVRAFVSGLPGDKSRLRNFMVLQVCLDGSADGDGKRVFVLAGYIATAEAWAGFAAEWQALLDTYGIQSFKYSKHQKRPDMCEAFYRVIENHDIPAAVDCVIDLREVHKVMHEMQWPDGIESFIRKVKNPFFLASKAVMRNLVVKSTELGLTEPIDFVYDFQSEMSELIGAWNYFKHFWSEESLKKLGNSPPAAKSDDEFNPLQAADLLAGYIRKAEQKDINSLQSGKIFPWNLKKPIKRYSITFNEQILREEYEWYLSNENFQKTLDFFIKEKEANALQFSA